MMLCATLLILYLKVPLSEEVTLDKVDCGIDHETEVTEGLVPIDMYPWLGVLYYTYYGGLGETRAITTVALIHAEFLVAVAADIGPMPKIDFRRNARVLLGEGWEGRGRSVRNYVFHPQYPETYSTLALIQLRQAVKNPNIIPLCPPPERLRMPQFYIVKFDENLEKLKKHVIPVEHVPASLCRDFYISANLYEAKMRPPHVTCAIQLETLQPCVWDAGAALVARDIWGRWQLLGFGVRGPGCGAPSRYLDMMSYYPWIETSLNKFQKLTISKINDHKFVLRTGTGEAGAVLQRFGACDPEEKKSLIYRDVVVLRSDNTAYQFATYNMTIYDAVEYSCLTLELVNASASSEMRVKHLCPRVSYGPACHAYRGSIFEISVFIMFSDNCLFDMQAWGWHKNMTLLDIQEWKWEEGTYYEDFNLFHTEYRGPTYMTEFGFEGNVLHMWTPEYTIWGSTEFDNSTTTTKEPMADSDSDKISAKVYEYNPTIGTTTTIRTKPTFRLKEKNVRTRARTRRPMKGETPPATLRTKRTRQKLTNKPTTTTEPPPAEEAKTLMGWLSGLGGFG